MGKSLVMTLLVRDAEDVLRENLLFHRTQGVEHFIITDNLSSDGTLEIIDEFVREGMATLIREPGHDYQQARWVTRMARLAKTEHDARWVINNDQDEFWYAGPAGLGDFFARIPFFRRTANAPRHDFVCVEEPAGAPFWHRMVYRKKHSINALGRPLPSKVAHRGNLRIEILPGNHGVKLSGLNWPQQTGLEIWHFPVRTRQQYLNKIRAGGEAMQRNQTAHITTCETWRQQHAELNDTGRSRFLEDQVADNTKLAKFIAQGEVVHDPRLQEILARLLPDPPPPSRT